MATREKVINAIAERLAIDEEQVTDASSLHEDLGADSLDVVEIQMDLEETGIAVSDDNASKWRTVADVIADAEKVAK